MTAIDDTIVEGNETIQIDIDTVSGGAAESLQNQAIVTIIDDDVVYIDLSVDSATVAENGASVTITATLTGGTHTGDVLVGLIITGSALTGVDYTLTDTDIEIDAGDTT